MATVKSFTVGDGDMFYISHNSDNFTIIDCQLIDHDKAWLVEELRRESRSKGITRFISTHPDEDHIEGLAYLDDKMRINNFYVVKNKATKKDPTISFNKYCELRDGDKAFYVQKGSKRKWMNVSDEVRSTSGVNILWPDRSNKHFQYALEMAERGEAFNNISLVARYSIQNSASFMWIGDLEKSFMEEISDSIDLPETTVVFAPHHGRRSGKLPDSWLERLQPKIIVIGEAASRHLDYYTGYNKITQNRAGDITFLQEGNKLHCFASEEQYGMRDWLNNEGMKGPDFYIGTLTI